MILKVARMGHPVLRQTAEPVPPDQITSPDIQSFIDDLIETMHEYDGAGLAAPQVHVSKQIVVIEPGDRRQELSNPGAETIVYINPEITPLTENMDEDWEGCLSVPGLRGRVPRYTKIRFRAYDRHGQRLDLIAEGFAARVIQHECDHLWGKLYIDRIRDTTSLTFIEEFMKYGVQE
ncbi:peptide deformylase [Candidatus Entotheonella palauensis]|uniref:Peptide deformylase n=1 Tax=Candidatus Entotheonella gemina TaxID=1429439 RepID=W4LTL9_9BACT|nr:peptide deformylase [Candidatus Entotheonella palauensis]ETX01318.1 MAG: peptide deformylase [Candidatus Entotheonella gemina]